MTITASSHSLYCEKLVVAFSGYVDSELGFDLVFIKNYFLIIISLKSTSCLKVCSHIVYHAASFQLDMIGNF